METNIAQAVFEEFVDDPGIIRLNKRHFDPVDDHYAIPKVKNKAREKREINRFDGQKIFVGNQTMNDLAMKEEDAAFRPAIIKAAYGKSYIKTWEVNDMDDAGNNGYFNHEQDLHSESGVSQNSFAEPGIYEAKGLSKEIIENAKKEAQNILENANVELKEIKDQAHQEGYQSGFAQVNTEIDVLRKIQVELNHIKEEIISNSENDVIDLVKIIAQKMFTNGIELDENILKNIVGRAVNEASRIGNLKVYLNPNDLEKLKKLWRESELDYNGQKIQLASNNEVLPGGVFIEGDYGSVDGRIQSQLKGVIDSITDIQLDQIEA